MFFWGEGGVFGRRRTRKSLIISGRHLVCYNSTEDLYGIRKDKRSSHDFVLRDSLC